MAHIEKVQLNYLAIAPRKVRLIGNTLKGMSIVEAQAQLMLRPQRSADALLKLLNSAIANAKHNKQIGIDTLRVKQVIVDPAPVLKRSLPRAQGRTTSIFKRMSHVTIVIEEVAAGSAARFVIAAPEKKQKKEKEQPTRKATKAEQKKDKDIEHTKPEKKLSDAKEHDAEQRKPNNRGGVKRFFNRKAI
jgi:large subunit ribosomal protein L22